MDRLLVNLDHRCAPSDHNRGLALLEVLIALALVSVVLLGLAGLSTVAIKGANLSREMTTGVTLAQDKLEEIRLSGYQPSLSGAISQVEPYGSMTEEPLYTRTVSVQPNTPTVGLQTITVTVQWDADAHSSSLSTMLAE